MRKSSHNLSKLKLVQFISNCKVSNRGFIISNLSDNSIDVICECIFNVCKTNLGLSKKDKNRIKKRYSTKQRCLKILGNKNKSVSHRRIVLSKEALNLKPLLNIAVKSLQKLIFKSK